MGLSETMRRLIEKNTGFTIPLDVGDPGANLTVGTIIDMDDDSRPTVGHLASAPFNLDLGTVSQTGELDVDLGLSRLVSVSGGLDGAATGQESVSVGLKLKYKRDVVLSLEPARGQRLDVLPPIASALKDHPAWEFGSWAFVFRTYAVKSARMHIARKGDGEITLSGKASDVSQVITGTFNAGVQWQFKNVLTEKFDAPGVLGVHCVRVRRNGKLDWV